MPLLLLLEHPPVFIERCFACSGNYSDFDYFAYSACSDSDFVLRSGYFESCFDSDCCSASSAPFLRRPKIKNNSRRSTEQDCYRPSSATTVLP